MERQVFVYCHYSGMKPSEIAESLSLEEVRVCRILRQRDRRLFQALRPFRKDLQRENAPESYSITVALEKCLF
jgi:DNA-directed RNA polymerase specialized sigma24 family protein